MLYIITGIAKAGKTYVTNKIVQNYKLGYFSSDYLMMSLAKGNKTIGVNPNASDITVSNQLQPYLEAMIKTMVENKIDYILEGVHFQPEFVRSILDKYPDQIEVIFLGYKDIDTLKKVEEMKLFGPKTQNHWYSNMNDQELTQLVEYMKNECQKLYDNCLNHNLPYFEVYDIVSQSDEIIKRLMHE